MSTVSQTPPLAARIRRARLEAGLLQSELAEKVGRSARAVQAWEAGDSAPRGKSMRLLAFATGKDVAWFFEAEIAA